MWLYLALTSATLIALSTLIIKHLLKDVKPIPLLVIVHLFAFPFFVIFTYFFGIPHLSIEFMKFVFIAGTLGAIAAYASYKALSISDISLITPLSAFIPFLALIWGYLFLNEIPTLSKLTGIIIIVIGAYFLDIKVIKEGPLKPFTKLFSNHGVRLYMIAVFCWSLAPIFEKQSISETIPINPAFAAFFIFTISTLILLPFAIKDGISMKPIKKHINLLMILGIFFAVFSLASFTAFVITNVAYVIAITRLATLFVILLGAFVMHEKDLKERALGGTIMIIGAILVAI